MCGNLEDAIPVEDKEAARQGFIELGQGRRTSATPRCGCASTPSTAPGSSTTSCRSSRRWGQARRDHDPQGRGALGHPLRRPAPGPARGAPRLTKPDPHPRAPRDGPGRQNVEAIAGAARACTAEPRPGGPGRLPRHEDHARRRRAPVLRRPRRPGRGPGPRLRPAGPLALHVGKMVDACRCTGSAPSTAPSATSPTRPAARRSSATPSSWAAPAPGRSRPSQIPSPSASSAPTRTRCSSRSGSWRPCPTAPAWR
jgi:hypothetical protein